MTTVGTDMSEPEVPATQAPGVTPELAQARVAFQQASESLAKHETSKAAAEIRAGVTFVEHEAVRAGADIKHALEELAGELKKLADDVDKGMASTGTDLESAFARAATAVEDRLRASGRWTGEAVGDALNAVGTWLGAPGAKETPAP